MMTGWVSKTEFKNTLLSAETEMKQWRSHGLSKRSMCLTCSQGKEILPEYE